jgi:deoxyribose-phosphate aldolase
MAEIKQAIEDGVDELDMVHNLAALRNKDWDYLEKEITVCLQPIRLYNKIIKVIIESGILTAAEIIESCKLYSKHKVDFVKTSTGYAEKGALLEHIQIMRHHLPEEIAIKASGGIRNYAVAASMIVAGATRIGASAGIQIVNEANQ